MHLMFEMVSCKNCSMAGQILPCTTKMPQDSRQSIRRYGPDLVVSDEDFARHIGGPESGNHSAGY